MFRAGIGKFTITNQGNFANIDAGIATSDARTFQNFQGPGIAPLFVLPQATSGTFNPAQSVRRIYYLAWTSTFLTLNRCSGSVD